jgi:DNA-binding response OmpR family regulator
MLRVEQNVDRIGLWLAQTPPDQGAKTKLRTPIIGLTPQQKNKKILIVEDEMLVAENLKETLGDEGFNVIGVLRSGEEAIQTFWDTDPDLVVMDIRLAGSLDGIQTAIIIHSTMKQVPIIFLTAHAEDHFPHLSAVARERFIYLTKPCATIELTRSVMRMLK